MSNAVRVITSRQHPLVRAFKAAAHGSGDRALLDGWHLLHDAATADVEITVVAIAGEPPAPRDRVLLDRLARAAEVVTVTPAVMDAISPVRTPAGVVALGVPRSTALPALLTPAPALVLVADQVQDPGNCGAIIRSAEAGGATGALFTGASADPWGWKALRAAMGSTFRLPVLKHGDALDACRELRRQGLHLFAAVPRGGSPLHEVDWRGPSALILGGEGGGVDETVLDAIDRRVSIPMSESVESLNVAVAAALLVYEARRQRVCK